MPFSGDAAFDAAARLIDALVRRGLCGIVVAPGSRSTPLVLAASRHGGVRVRVVLDERSASFAALGLAMETGRPAATICTSGTAAANQLPAAVEASMAGVPLIIVTADRPARLRGTGANQTIDQRALFGVHATFLDGEATDDWAALGVSAFDAAMAGPRGAVHVNLPFDEPLIPESETRRVETGVQAWTEQTPHVDPGALDDVLSAERGAIVVGPLASGSRAIADLGERAGWPVLAEPLSNVQGLTASEHVVADRNAGIVVQVGGVPTTRAMQAFVARAERLIVVERDGRGRDPSGRAERTIQADPNLLASAALGRVDDRSNSTWLDAWRQADAAAREALDAALDAGEQQEVRVARDVAAAVAPGSRLVIGNSGPVRDLCVGMLPRADVRVLGNRGASGIDGLVSTVVGVSWGGHPTVGLIGDLSVLHDASGLLWCLRQSTAALVVINNGGGHLFDRLPSATLPEHERFFVTPHAVDLAALAAAAGVEHRGVTPADVATAVGAARGPVLIEVSIPQA